MVKGCGEWEEKTMKGVHPYACQTLNTLMTGYVPVLSMLWKLTTGILFSPPRGAIAVWVHANQYGGQ